MSATRASKRGRDVRDRVRTAMLGASPVLVTAVIGSCVPLAGEHVPAEEAPDLAARAEVEDHHVRLETRVFTLAYIRAEGSRRRARAAGKSDSREPIRIEAVPGPATLLQLLEKVKSERGAIGAVPGTNALVVTDTPAKLEAMGRIIRRLDRPPKQVHFSVKLVVLSDKDAEKVRERPVADRLINGKVESE
ncbi:MAG: secretin N-terminal domain-containing protein, partial [Planctomycetota bacterium]